MARIMPAAPAPVWKAVPAAKAQGMIRVARPESLAVGLRADLAAPPARMQAEVICPGSELADSERPVQAVAPEPQMEHRDLVQEAARAQIALPELTPAQRELDRAEVPAGQGGTSSAAPADPAEERCRRAGGRPQLPVCVLPRVVRPAREAWLSTLVCLHSKKTKCSA
jgi:hypothetical protein